MRNSLPASTQSIVSCCGCLRIAPDLRGICCAANSNKKLELGELQAVFGAHAEEFLKFCDQGDKDKELTVEEFTAGIIADCTDVISLFAHLFLILIMTDAWYSFRTLIFRLTGSTG